MYLLMDILRHVKFNYIVENIFKYENIYWYSFDHL